MVSGQFPTEGMELTRLLVVRDVGRARPFYVDILGATVHSEGESYCVLRFLGDWLLLVLGGGAHTRQADRDLRTPFGSRNSERRVYDPCAGLSWRLRDPQGPWCRVPDAAPRPWP